MCLAVLIFVKAKKVLNYGFLYFLSLNVLESEHLEVTFKILWSLGLAAEKVEMSQACKEKH